MIKSILVGLDGYEHARAGVEYAFWLAQRLNGEVLGLHVVDIVSIEGPFLPDVSGSMGFEPYVDFTGCIHAFAVVDLRKEMGDYDWRIYHRTVK